MGVFRGSLYLPETPYDIKLTELLVTFTAPMRISKSCPEPARQGSAREAILAEPSLAASFTTWLRSLLLQLFQAPPQSTTVSTAFGTPLAVRVTDTGSLPVAGVPVSFSAPGGASATFSATTCYTDVSGECSVTAIANGTVGNYNVEATVSGLATSAVFALMNTIAAAPTPASIPTLGEWGLIIMSSLIAILGLAIARRRS